MRNKTTKKVKNGSSRNRIHGGCSSCMSGGCSSCMSGGKRRRKTNSRIRLVKKQWGCDGNHIISRRRSRRNLHGGDANLNTVMANNVTYSLNNYNNDPQYMLSNARNDPMPGGRRRRGKTKKVGGNIINTIANALGATGTSVQNNAPNFQQAGRIVPLV